MDTYEQLLQLEGKENEDNIVHFSWNGTMQRELCEYMARKWPPFKVRQLNRHRPRTSVKIE